MNKLFIVLEGLSASGKTTIGKLLAKKNNGIFYRTPSILFNKIRKSIDQDADVNTRFFFYLSGLIQSSIEITKLLKTQNVVCDRYLSSTLYTHKAMNVKVDKLVIASNLPLKKPDFSFLITCDEKKRIKRMQGRGMDHNDKREINFNLEQKTLKEYRKHCQLVEVDNSSDNPIYAVNKILDFISKRTNVK